MTVQEAKVWLLLGALACIKLGHDVGDQWCLEALWALSVPQLRRSVAHNNEDAAKEQRRMGSKSCLRDARILCFCAAVLRAVDEGAR